MVVRSDLDGCRVRASDTAEEIWLIFHGMRHYIANAAVYEALFFNSEIRIVAEAETILRGPDLLDGTVLIRGSEGHIYLVTAISPHDVRRFLISNWETFQAFGFNIEVVKDVPPIIVSAIACAPQILIAFS